MRPHISYSEWINFRNGCQHRWKLDYLDEKRSKNFGIHMDFGTSVHAALELYKPRLPNPYAGLDVPIIDLAIFFFKEVFKNLYERNREQYREHEKDLEVEFFLEAGERILRGFDSCGEIAEAEVVYNEHELMVDIDRSDDVQMKFKGFIDMVIKTKDKRGNTILYVCDFKTCSWGWPREKREDRELHFQILLYKHFLCKKFSLDPKLVRTAFVLLKKKPKKDESPIEWFPISAGPVSVQRAVDELNVDLSEMDDRIKRDDFKKDRDQCHNKFGDTCPYLDTDLCKKD